MKKELNSRQKQALATKKKIFDTAKELFSQYGFDAVTVDQITQTCGIGKGTFYHYYKSKEELIISIERIPYAEIMEKIKELGKQPLEQRMKNYILLWFERMDQDDITFTSQWMKHAVDLSVRNFFGDTYTKMDFDMDMIRRIYEDGIAEGVLKQDTPVEILTTEILFSMEGSAVYRCVRRGQFDVMEWAETFSQLVLEKFIKPYLA